MLSGVCVRTFVTSLIVGQYDTMSGGGVDGPHPDMVAWGFE